MVPEEFRETEYRKALTRRMTINPQREQVFM